MTEQTKQALAIINAQEIDFVKGLKKVAESRGYEINYCYVEVSKTGFERLYIKIEPKDFNTRHLSEPEIFRKSTCGKSFDNKPIFRVSTTSYGTLNEEEMQKFMDAMNNGFSMQCYLNNLDWSKVLELNLTRTKYKKNKKPFRQTVYGAFLGVKNMIYISGRITGNKNWHYDFRVAQDYLETKRYKAIINPLYLEEQVKKEFKKPTYTDYMKQDIELLILCDEIYMLRGWWRSKGARLERHIAKVLGMKIIYQKRGDK